MMLERMTLLWAILVLGISGFACAEVYDFDHQVWGTSSIELNNAAGRQTFVELTENLATPENDVLLKFTNYIPAENTTPYGDAAIKYIYFDTGNFADLITGIGIWEQSAGVQMLIPGARPTMGISNSFDTYFTEDFSVGLGQGYPANVHGNGVNPGEYIVLNVTLGQGKTFTDLINAINVGRDANEVVARTGVRISEVVHRIWGVQENDDHGAFVLTKPVPMAGLPTPRVTSLTATPLSLLDTQTSQLSIVAQDPDYAPQPLSYQWTIVSGGGALQGATSPAAIYTPADIVGVQSVVVRVEVSDGANLVTGMLTLQVTDANAPVPNKAPQISAVSAAPGSLLDTGISNLTVTVADPDNGPQMLSYQWTVVNGGGVIDNPTSPTPTYSPADVVGNQSVTLRITVSDGATSVSSDLVLQVQDANPPPPGSELLAESFASGSLAGWSVHDEGTPTPSKWRIVSGRVTQESSISDGGWTEDLARRGTYLAYDEGVGWTDYRFKVTVLTLKDDDTWGVMFRVRDANNYYRLTWDKQRSQRRLVKNAGGVFTLLAADNVPYEISRPYQIEIVTRGPQLEVWIDNLRVFQVTDATHAHGTIAFHTWLQIGTHFDDARVEDLSGGRFNAVPKITGIGASPSAILDTQTSSLTVTANDPDGGPQALSYQWTIVSGGGVLDQPTSATPVYKPADVIGIQSIPLRVEVSDGAASVIGNVTVQVKDADAPPLGPLLFSENFASGSLAGWTVHDEGTPTPSKWRIVSGRVTQESSISDGGWTPDLARLGTYLSYNGGTAWTNYRLKVTVLTLKDDDTWGVMFRVRDADNYYRLTWDMQRNQRRLVKKEGGVFTLLAADNVPYVLSRPYKVELVADGSRLEVWVDDARIFQVTDTAHAQGTIALHTWLQIGTHFDDIQVNAIE
jgi:hypothetical protein